MNDMKKKNFVAPDGGWGWIIVCAYALSVFAIPSISQGFIMIYGDKFEGMGISATKMTIIINVNQAFGMIVGLVSVPLLRTYGYRKIAVIGQLLFAFGIILTSFATSFIHFIITYGMMASLGSEFNFNANSIALNAYFEKKRGRATGLSLMITGVALIVFPQLISLMLSIYGSQGTMLIMGAISLNHLVGGFLLQPVEWHAKQVKDERENSENGKDDTKNKFTIHCTVQEIIASDNKIENKKIINNMNPLLTIPSNSFKDDNINISGFETSLTMKENCVLNVQDWLQKSEDLNMENKNQLFEKLPKNDFESISKRRKSLNDIKLRKVSIISLKLDNTLINKIYSKQPDENQDLKWATVDGQMQKGTYKQEVTSVEGYEKAIQKKKKLWFMHTVHQVIEQFDLELLHNRMFIIIAVGISIITLVEVNFIALMPLILAEMNFDIDDVATTLSLVGISELVFRGLSPFIGEWLHKPPMAMFLFSLMMLAIVRTVLLFINTRAGIWTLAFFLGTAKGFRIVYMNVLLPNAVSIEKLPAANSIQSLLNGLIFFITSPVIGIIKDITGNYDFCIVFLNLVTLTVFLSILLQVTIKYIKKRRKLNTFYKLKQLPK